MLQLSNFIQKDSKKPKLIISKIDTVVGRKLYVPIHLSFMNSKYHQLSAMVDSGSDITICQVEYFVKAFPEYSKEFLMKNLESTGFTLTSYTNHKISIKGKATVLVKLSEFEKPIEIDLYIVDNHRNERSNSPVIFSLYTLSRFNINIKFTSINNTPTPMLIRDVTAKNATQALTFIPTYYHTDIQLSMAHGYITKLPPGGSTHVHFIVPPSSPYLPGDLIIITQDAVPYEGHKGIRIIPSTSTIEILEKQHIIQAYVHNTGRTDYTGVIVGSLELINSDFKLQKITTRNCKKMRQQKVGLLAECRHPSQTGFATKRIILHKQIKFTKDEDQVVNNQLFSLDVVFPEFSPDLSNPKAINNDVTEPGQSLSGQRHPVKERARKMTEEERQEFYDPNKSIQLGFRNQTGEITQEDLEPRGVSIPSSVMETPRDILEKIKYEPHIWPYVEKIFLTQFPEVISRHSLDTGSLSQSLGYYHISLKPNVTLPKYRKLYYLAPLEASMLRDVLEFLEKTRVITKAPSSGGDHSQFASPCFLVRRANMNAAARLVVNFKLINECISVEPISLSNFSTILNQMGEAVLYTSMDLKSAFNSIELHPDSKKYAMFNSQWGCYYFNTLCTGMVTSPEALSKFCDMMINHLPRRNSKGEVMYNKLGYPIMDRDNLGSVCVYYDDVVIYTKPKETYTETLRVHFELVEEVVRRLHFHKAKLEMTKAKFGCAKINFLGWNISNGHLQPDMKRIEKIQTTPFPSSVKQMRSYLGLLNTLRSVLHFDILRYIHILTPLTSSKLEGSNFMSHVTDEHRHAYNVMNKMLTEGPLYSKICLPGTPKLLLSDSASERNAQFACVLAQIVPAMHPSQQVPYFLFLDDRCHQIIYDSHSPVRPIPLMTAGQTDQDYLVSLKAKNPPQYDYLTEDTMGYGSEVGNSLGITLRLMLLATRATIPFLETCKKIETKLTGGIANSLILDHVFGDDDQKLKRYKQDIRHGQFTLDKNLYLMHAIADALGRTIKVVDSRAQKEENTIKTFNPGKPKPPFYILLYAKGDKLITRPTLLELHTEYALEKHRGSFEIILYHSSTIPPAVKGQKIYDLELYSFLSSLKAVEKLVGGDELLALVDNKVLYFLFNQDAEDSFAKVKRWGKKVREDWPLLKLGFITSKNNISDWLTRCCEAGPPEIARIHLPTHVSDLLDDYIPDFKIWSIQEWIDFGKQNPQFMQFEKKQSNQKRIQNKEEEKEHSYQHINKKLKATRQLTSVDNQSSPITEDNSFFVRQLRTYEEVSSLPKLRPQKKQLGVDELAICAIKLDTIVNKLNQAGELSKAVFGGGYSPAYVDRNTQGVFNPIKSLEQLITQEKIMEYQQVEYAKFYNQCATSTNKEFKENNTRYFLELGVLYVQFENKAPKLWVPSELINKYVAMAHLSINHGGSRKMILNLENYYHALLQKKCITYAQSCFACRLVNHSTRSQKMGRFPLDADVMEILHMDLIESLGSASGFNHILVCKCPISNYIILAPMVTKEAKEFKHVFNTIIHPHFSPRALYTDNATFFVSKDTVNQISLMGTEMIYSSAFSGSSHGGVERYVGLFKGIFKKLLSVESNYNWSALPGQVARLHNSSKLSKSGYSPLEILYGTNKHLSTCFLDRPNKIHLHPVLQSQREVVESKIEQTNKILAEVRKSITEDRDKRTDRLNKTRVTRSLEKGDIVFIKDRSKILGSTKPLKTTYLKSPFILIHPMEATCVVKKISDGWVTCRKKDDIRKYIPFQDFDDMPEAVLRICKQESYNLTKEDILQLISNEDLDFDKFSPTDIEIEETQEIIESFDQPPPEIQEKPTEIAEQLLIEDATEEYSPPLTRSRVREEAAKRIAFSPDTKLV